MKYLNININCTLRESTSSKYRVVQTKSTNTITHLEILINQRIYRILHVHLYVDVPLKEENLWIAHAYGSSKRGPAGGGGWIQLWNLLQEYVLNTFYAEGRLKNERA